MFDGVFVAAFSNLPQERIALEAFLATILEV
jgi:hypothetical protein